MRLASLRTPADQERALVTFHALLDAINGTDGMEHAAQAAELEAQLRFWSPRPDLSPLNTTAAQLDPPSKQAGSSRDLPAAGANACGDDVVGAVRAVPGTFHLKSPFAPSGDQPEAITSLIKQVDAGTPRIALRGATGTGKTFVMAKVIEQVCRPALIVAPNKAQLWAESLMVDD